MAVNPLIRTTSNDAAPRGDEVHIPLVSNPYANTEDAPEYENGYQYAQSIGHRVMAQVTGDHVAGWQRRPQAWRDGFAAGATTLGRADIGNAVTKRASVSSDWIGRRASFIARHEDHDGEGKSAGLKMSPLPHQTDVAEQLEDSPGLVVAHGIGSGKTLTAINAAHTHGLPLLAITPASLRNNMKKEVEAAGFKGEARVMSYGEAANKIHDPEFRGFASRALVAFDEAHRAGRAGSARSGMIKEIPAAKKLFLTGTPFRNSPAELGPLLNSIENVGFPETEHGFRKQYLKPHVHPVGFWGALQGIKPGISYHPTNVAGFKELVSGKVHAYEPVDRSAYPSFHEEIVEVPMSARQQATYDFVTGKYPSIMYQVRHGIPMDAKHLHDFMAFFNAPRRVTNSPREFNASAAPTDASKIQAAVGAIKERHASDPDYRGVTYSAFLESGIRPIADELQASGIPFAEFTGQQDDAARKRIVTGYNSGAIKHLLISGAGAEGLDLKGTKLLQVMEPHWNEALIDQVKGRAIRYKSHEHLPENERHVTVQRFHSIPRRGWLDRIIGRTRAGAKSVDEYIYDRATEKRKLNEPFLQALRQSGESKTGGLFPGWHAWVVHDGE